MEPTETLGTPPRCEGVPVGRAATKRSIFDLSGGLRNSVFSRKNYYFLGIVVKPLLFIKQLLSKFVNLLAIC